MVNAFWLDRDLEQAAAWLVDQHVTSSVFECSMVLTTALSLRGLDREDLYVTHTDNPLTVWAAESLPNWRRLYEYTAAAHDEWRYRWEHDPAERHACWAVVDSLSEAAVTSRDWPSESGRDPPQLTGEWEREDYVDAYRYYYANEKRHLFAWSRDRERPPWIDEYTVGADAEDDGAGDSGDGEGDGLGDGEGDGLGDGEGDGLGDGGGGAAST